MIREIRPAIVLLLGLTLITGLAYPLAMTAVAGVIFPKQAEGSLIEKDGKVVGSALIGQEFKSDKYFHGRPSATLAPDPNDATKTVAAPYNAANSGGSNLGPTSKALNDRVKEEVDRLKAENPTSHRKPPFSRSPVWPRPATCPRRRSVSSSQTTPRAVSAA
jgi:potassium-transporting ATPase KdpC subunit